MTDRRLILQAALRTDLVAFTEKCFQTLEPGTAYKDNWHIAAIAHQLMRVRRGECKRLIINIPPRSMKSISVSVAFTAWLMGHDPRKRIMAISYASKLAEKLNVDTRTILTSPWFAGTFPSCRISGIRKDEIQTDQRGYRLAGTISGTVLGRGADLIVIDDPIKALAALSEAERRRVAEFYDNTLYTRLDDKVNGAIVIVMQRLHEDDLVGHVLRKEDWDILSIPAVAIEACTYRVGDQLHAVYHRDAGEVLHPDREPIETLEQLRRSLGSMNFSAQYQQDPMPAAGNVIKREWLRHYQTRPAAFERVITSWDTASTLGEASDWSVGTVWGSIGQDFYLLDVVRGRWESPALRQKIIDLHRKYNADATIIEHTELGRALAQDLRRTGSLRPITHPVRFDKQARLLAQAARFEAGQVFLPVEAEWLQPYLNELLAFPSGRNDDQVDATSQALSYLTKRSPTKRPRPRGNSVATSRRSRAG